MTILLGLGGFDGRFGYLGEYFWIFGYVFFGGFAALGDIFAFVGVPGAGFFDDAVVGGQIDKVAFSADALVVHDVEFGLAERRSDFVFDDFDADVVADNGVALLNLADAADIHSDTGV